MENYLYFLHRAYEIKIYSFVLMPNHFHLLAQNPLGNLSEAMNYFMRETSRQIGRDSGRINQIYGARFHRSLISTERYFYQVYKYVYRNPVRAEICTEVQTYPFSTISGLVGLQKLYIPLEPDNLLFSGDDINEKTILWLNKTPDPKLEKEIQLALRRTEYELPKNQNSEKSSLEKIDFY
jgi:putative transposase